MKATAAVVAQPPRADRLTGLAHPRRLFRVLARNVAPRKKRLVSEWADAEFHLSGKGNNMAGKWRTDRNPPLREPLDVLSASSSAHDVVCKFPIQFGKTALGLIFLGYTMDENPGPFMQVLPDEETLKAWVNQKLTPTLEEVPAMQRALISTSSRNASNTKTFKDFSGGQLFAEHAGTPSRLKLKSIRDMVIDEVDSILRQLASGDDPRELLKGRTSSFPSTYKRLWIGSPGIKGLSAIDDMYEASDRRRLHVPCPHCGELQPLEWSGLQWTPGGKQCWYVCQHNGCVIEEHHKSQMIAFGRWIAESPGALTIGFTINCLYYQFGLGPRWLDLVRMWLEAQNDPATLKTFVNDRLAEAWEDPAMRAVKQNVIKDRAEPYCLRLAPEGVLAITAGVDTQDGWLALQIVGWGRGLVCWVLDYIELTGDPAEDAVWAQLTDVLNRPIEHVSGALLNVEAIAIDAGGHRTEAVKAFCRRRVVRRPLCIFGAVPNNAPVLSKGKLQDVNYRGALDKKGVTIHHVGTVGIKHLLYSRLSTDADKAREARLVHLSDQLDDDYFAGLVSERYNPVKNRFDKIRTRNEPLDTWGYAYAATHHNELRLHRLSRADWDERDARIRAAARAPESQIAGVAPSAPRQVNDIAVIRPRVSRGTRNPGL